MMRSYGILGCPVFDLFSDHRRQIRRVGGSREHFPATWPGVFPLQRTELNFMAMSQGNRMVTDLPGFSHCVSHAQIMIFFRFWKIFWKHMEVKSPCWPFFWEDREMFPVTGVWVSSLSRTRNIFCSTLGTCHCWDGKLNGRTQTTWNPWLSEDMWSFLHENIWFEHVWTI